MAASRRRGWALGLQLLGAAILVVAAFLPWYSVQVTGPYAPESVTSTFSFAGVRSESTGFFGESTSSYLGFGDYPLPATGALYAGALVALTAGVVLACAAVLLAARKGTPTVRRLATLLGLLACVAAVAAPAALALGQPGTICQDSRYFAPPLGLAGPGANTTSAAATGCTWSFDLGNQIWNGGYSNGPQLSFAGHSGALDGSYAWGPTLGWFLPFVAAALLAGGAVLGWRAHPREPSAAPNAA